MGFLSALFSSSVLMCPLFCSVESKQGPGLTLASYNNNGKSNNKKKNQVSIFLEQFSWATEIGRPLGSVQKLVVLLLHEVLIPNFFIET